MHNVNGVRYCAVRADNLDTVYIIADAFREKFLQILGQELHVVAQFDGDLSVILCCVSLSYSTYRIPNPILICKQLLGKKN